MNFSKLSASDRMAAFAAIATVVGAIPAAATYPRHYGLTWLAALLAIGMLAVVFLPQLSPTTKLPGTKGSQMVAIGAIAAVLMAFVFLTTLAFTFDFDVISIFFLVAVAGALVMGWTGWQSFQAEGGKFNIGMAGGGSAAPGGGEPGPVAPPPAPPAAPTYTPPPAPDPESSEDELQA